MSSCLHYTTLLHQQANTVKGITNENDFGNTQNGSQPCRPKMMDRSGKREVGAWIMREKWWKREQE